MLIDEQRLAILREKSQRVGKVAQDNAEGTLSDKNALITIINSKCIQKQNLQLLSSCRGHNIPFDEPPASGGDDTALTPAETLLCAYSGCLEINWVLYSSVYQRDLKKVEVEIIASLDKRYVLGSKYKIPARFHSLTIISHLYTNEQAEKFDRVFEKVKEMCIVGNSLSNEIPREYKLEFHSV